MMILFHESYELVKGELILLSFCNPLITKKKIVTKRINFEIIKFKLYEKQNNFVYYFFPA